MNRQKRDEPKVPHATVTINTVDTNLDRELTMTPAEADQLVNSFLHDRYIKINDCGTITYINVRNIINIEVTTE